MRPNLRITRRHAGFRPVLRPGLGNQVFPEPKPRICSRAAFALPGSDHSAGRSKRRQRSSRAAAFNARHGAPRTWDGPYAGDGVESDMFSGQAGRGLDRAPRLEMEPDIKRGPRPFPSRHAHTRTDKDRNRCSSLRYRPQRGDGGCKAGGYRLSLARHSLLRSQKRRYFEDLAPPDGHGKQVVSIKFGRTTHVQRPPRGKKSL